MEPIPFRTLVKHENPRMRKVKLRPVEVTTSLENELYLIYKWVVDEWRSFISTTLIPAYERPAPLITRDADGEQIQWLIDQKNADIDNRLIYQTEKLGRWVTRFGEWHGARTIAAAKSATGVDIAPYIRLGDVRPVLEAAIRENTALIKDLNQDAKKRVEQVIFESFALRRTKAETVKALAKAMGITQRRARNIATDQAHKLNSLLTQLRQEQLGFSGYIWRTRRDDRVRKAHAERENKLFLWSRPPYDGHPGWPIACRCVAEAYMDLEER